MVSDSSAMRFTHVIGWDTSARAHVHILFQYLWKGLMNCEIWLAVRDSAYERFAGAKGRMHPHMCTCKPSFSFCARSFIAEYGVLLVPIAIMHRPRDGCAHGGEVDGVTWYVCLSFTVKVDL